MKNRKNQALYACLVVGILGACACDDSSSSSKENLSCPDGAVVCGGGCCAADKCVDGACQDGGQISVGCKETENLCNGNCVSKNSPLHCGNCDTVCKDYEACVDGQCSAKCPNDYAITEDGKCLNLQVDNENCGEFGHKCADRQYCYEANCKCGVGYHDCDGDASNGCESEIACELLCDMECGEAQRCVSQKCECISGHYDCDGDASNGCESIVACEFSCEDGKTSCGENECYDLTSDVHHCGGCLSECKASQKCENSGCVEAKCDDEKLTSCWGECVDLMTDSKNCGECDNACENGYVCDAGQCKIECSADDGKDRCGTLDSCYELASDPRHCGTCAVRCNDNQVCGEGEVPELDEEGKPKLDEEGNPVMTKGPACVDSDITECTCPEDTPDCGLTDQCWGKCVNKQTDTTHCGTCGNECKEGYACIEGTCTIQCGEGELACGDECMKPSDVRSCGACDVKCETTQQCVTGDEGGYICKASSEITEGFSCACAEDDKECVPTTECWGACVDIKVDPANCGGCGIACEEGKACTDGVCVEKTGEESTVKVCHGKEVDTATDNDNCGKCLNKCGENEVCTGGKCIIQCTEEGYDRCLVKDDVYACFNTTNSDAHCGSCDTVCKNGQTCNEGVCECAAGRWDCDGDAANGCESTMECACTPGDKQPCWRGSAETRGKGACKDGEQVCDKSGRFWGACEGGVYPKNYTQDDIGNALAGDQNCNGVEDKTETGLTRCQSMAGSTSYIGCEYWPAFLQNQDGFSTTTNVYFDLTLIVSNPSDSEDAYIYVFDDAKKSTSFDVTKMPEVAATETKVSAGQKFKVAPGQVAIKTIAGKQYGTYGYDANAFKDGQSCKDGAEKPADAAKCKSNKDNSGGTEVGNYMMKGSMQKANAFKVMSSIPVVVYQFNPYAKPETHSADASLLMPVSVLGKEYLTMGFNSRSEGDMADNINIVAVEPGETSVEITLKAKTADVGSGSVLDAGAKKTVKLKQYEVLSLSQKCDPNGEHDKTCKIVSNSTGTHVKADKKVEVFGAAGCGMVPTNENYCDHLEELIFPTNTWGTKYSAVKTKRRADEKDYYYILAQKDNTKVTAKAGNQNLQLKDKNDNPIANNTLKAGEYGVIYTEQSFDISATQPVMVGQFMVGSALASKIGDPSFIMNVPREQYRSDYTFAVPKGYDQDYVTVIAPKKAVVRYSGTINKVEYNEKALKELPDEINITTNLAGTTKMKGGQGFGDGTHVYYYLKLEGGTHKLTSDQDFGVIGYGFFNDTSYGYPAGLDLKPIGSN
ncbi:MAG: hypothetical protein IJM59_06085 [Proteobacteria bacterium]|nr:hypothetical protein [Pseudomonadota bacterium]